MSWRFLLRSFGSTSWTRQNHRIPHSCNLTTVTSLVVW